MSIPRAFWAVATGLAVSVSLPALMMSPALAQGAPGACPGGVIINADCTNTGNQTTTGGAATYFITGTAAVTNSGTISMNSSTSGEGNNTLLVNGNNVAFTLNNSGTISNTSTSANTTNGNAITIDATGASLTLTNSGTISSTANPTNATPISGVGVYVSSASLSATITNTATGSISGRYYGVSLNGTAASSVDNRGTITGGNYGIQINGTGPVTITNRGTLSGNAASILMQTGGHTLNIYDGAVFSKPVFFLNTNGSTINFYTGSYTLPVSSFKTATNTINLLGTGTQLVTSGLTNGTGNIVVIAPTVATTPAASTGNTVASASTVVNAIVNTPSANTLVPPLQGVTPEAPAPGGSALGFQQTALAVDPTFAEQLRAAFPDQALNNLNASADMPVLKAKQGQTVDAYGNLVWVRAFGSSRLTPSTATVVGNANTVVGMLFGYDRQIETWRVGAYGGYGFGYTKMLDASGTLATDYYMAGLYARRSFGAFTALANLAGGLMGNRSSRSINLGAEMATGAFSGVFIAPELALSYDMALAPGWTLTPTLRGRYVGAFMPGYSEGGSSQNVTYGANSSHALEERAELKLSRAFKGEQGLVSTVYGQVAALANQRIGSDSFNASALGTAFTVTNPYARSAVGGLVGVGFDHQISRQMTAFAGVDAAFYTDSTSAYIGRAGLRVAF